MRSPKLDSADEIEKIADVLLAESKAGGKFPTAVDKIVQCADLHVAGDIDLSQAKEGFFARTLGQTLKISSKILGLLDVRQKVILLDLSQAPKRQSFIKLHEVGHQVVPWQEAAYRIDDKHTLDPAVAEIFEREASLFASDVLFQGSRFMAEANKLPLSIQSAMALGDKFGASHQSAIRRYAERSAKRCSVLVLNKPTPSEPHAASIRNCFESKSFVREFGEIAWPSVCGRDFPFVQDLLRGRRLYKEGQLLVTTSQSDSTQFQYHYYHNSYNSFVLLFPVGEKTRSRTRVVVSKGPSL